MVRTTGAQLCQPSRVARIDESQDLFVILNGPDKTFLLADLTPQPGQNCGKSFASSRFIQRLIFWSPERFGVSALFLIFGLDVFGGFLDQRER